MPSCYMDREAQGSRAIKALASSGLYSSRALRLPVHIANSGIYSVYYEKCRVLTSNYNTINVVILLLYYASFYQRSVLILI